MIVSSTAPEAPQNSSISAFVSPATQDEPQPMLQAANRFSDGDEIQSSAAFRGAARDTTVAADDPPSLALDNNDTPCRPSRIPETSGIDDAIQYWEHGDPSRGLLVSLRLWGHLFDPSAYRTEAQKYSNISKVYREYAMVHKKDMVSFMQAFPGLRYCWGKLVHAVREARVARGETKKRKSRHGRA